jgi:chitin-binding protein
VTSTRAAQLRHGAVIQPRSRADIYFGDWRAHGLEAGKFFPETQSGLRDPYAPDDTRSATPPPDGKIASAGQDFAAELDEARTDWQKTPVKAGQQLEVAWTYHARHPTRRWNYFITRNGWDPNQPLTRAQFDPEPFHQVQNACQPFWSCGDELMPPDPTTHNLPLPQRSGYHVILAVWEVADTGNAFYQVIDTDFS